jgi:hypothetical protein
MKAGSRPPDWTRIGSPIGLASLRLTESIPERAAAPGQQAGIEVTDLLRWQPPTLAGVALGNDGPGGSGQSFVTVAVSGRSACWHGKQRFREGFITSHLLSPPALRMGHQGCELV